MDNVIPDPAKPSALKRWQYANPEWHFQTMGAHAIKALNERLDQAIIKNLEEKGLLVRVSSQIRPQVNEAWRNWPLSQKHRYGFCVRDPTA